MLNVKEKTMRFLEEFYVFEQVCLAMGIVDDGQYLGCFKFHLADFESDFESVRWLFAYQEKKVEAARKELADALVFCMIGGEKIQMRELGFVLEAYNKEEDIDAEDAEKYISASFDLYGAEQGGVIRYDEEGVYDKFMKKLFDTAIG